MKVTSIEDRTEEVEFVKKAAARFAEDPRMKSFGELNSFGELTPGSLLALRWGLHDRSVLVLHISESQDPVVYGDAVPRKADAA